MKRTLEVVILRTKYSSVNPEMCVVYPNVNVFGYATHNYCYRLMQKVEVELNSRP